MQDRVSVILALYNTPIELLDRAVSSVLKQTYRNVELILVDDCSPNSEVKDYIAGIVNSSNCSVVKYRKEKNAGVSDSLNIGVRLATGEYYCILDHDDYLLPDYIEKMVSCAVEAGADLVAGGMKTVNEDGEELSDYPSNKSLYYADSFPWISAVNLARLIRRSIVIDNDITYPCGAWTEDIIFTAKIYPYVRIASTLAYEGYVAFINPSSSSRSPSYHALRLEQIPVGDIKEIIENNNKARYPYVSGLMNNEMMLIGYMLTVMSDKAEKKIVERQFANLSRQLKCSLGEMAYYHRITGASTRERILDFVFNYSNRLKIELLAHYLINKSIRSYYNRGIRRQEK